MCPGGGPHHAVAVGQLRDGHSGSDQASQRSDKAGGSIDAERRNIHDCMAHRARLLLVGWPWGRAARWLMEA